MSDHDKADLAIRILEQFRKPQFPANGIYPIDDPQAEAVKLLAYNYLQSLLVKEPA